MHQDVLKFEVLIYHTMATRDLLVIWADYNSGGRIIVHLPYMAEVVRSAIFEIVFF